MSDTHIYINHSGDKPDGEGGPGTPNTTAKKDVLKSKLKGMTDSMAKQAPQTPPSDSSHLSQFDQNMRKAHGTPSGRVPGGLPVGFNPDEAMKQIPKRFGGMGDMESLPAMEDDMPIIRPSGPAMNDNMPIIRPSGPAMNDNMPVMPPGNRTQDDMLAERERYMKDVRNMQNQKVMNEQDPEFARVADRLGATPAGVFQQTPANQNKWAKGMNEQMAMKSTQDAAIPAIPGDLEMYEGAQKMNALGNPWFVPSADDQERYSFGLDEAQDIAERSRGALPAGLNNRLTAQALANVRNNAMRAYKGYSR